jgi:hypothetical protein
MVNDHGAPIYQQEALGNISPPTSLSPPGSSRSHAHPLTTSPPTAISPLMVSPGSAIGSNLSDLSPPWGYAHNSPYGETPMCNVSQLPQLIPPHGGLSPPHGGYGMVTGAFPHHYPRAMRGGLRPPRPRATRQNTTKSTVVKHEVGDGGEQGDEASGLGLTQNKYVIQPSKQTELISTVIPRLQTPPAWLEMMCAKPVSRASRYASLPLSCASTSPVSYIYSSLHLSMFFLSSLWAQIGRAKSKKLMRPDNSQRRRDELRKGFDLLRQTLPASNQRASKSNLLDRGRFQHTLSV